MPQHEQDPLPDRSEAEVKVVVRLAQQMLDHFASACSRLGMEPAHMAFAIDLPPFTQLIVAPSDHPDCVVQILRELADEVATGEPYETIRGKPDGR